MPIFGKSLLGGTAAALLLFSAQGMAVAAGPEDTLNLELKCGKVVINLRPDLAPKHVERIKKLTREGFYDGIIFHRVINGFMAQTGDPTGTGTGGSKYADIPAEFNKMAFRRGVVGMARSSSPNSANSQFFIMLADGRFLDGKYTAWGQVSQNMGCVDRLAKGEPPASPDKIIKMQVAADAK